MLTVSDVGLYIRCPRAYKFKVIGQVQPKQKSIALCKSIAARQVIYSFHSEGKELSEYTQEDITTLCTKLFNGELTDPLVDQESLETIVIQAKKATKKRDATPAITAYDKALKEIIAWCSEYCKQEDNSEVLYSNVYFEDTIADTTFCGHIDQVRKTDSGEFEVIVFKTSCQKPHHSYLIRDFSLLLMAHSVWQGVLYPKDPNMDEHVKLGVIPKMIVYYLPYLDPNKRTRGENGNGVSDKRKNAKIELIKSQKELLHFEYEILQIVSGIAMEYFPMRAVNPCGCSFCDYVSVCDINEKGVLQ